PTMSPVDSLGAGEVGYVVTGLKDVSKVRVGDTITTVARRAGGPLPGYKGVKPMVFAGLFPPDSDAYPELRDALERLKLNDAALVYEPETSKALGFGFRAGFLGLLHMEIVRERLEREFDLDLLVTAPNVAYQVQERSGDWREEHNPAEFRNEVEEVEEPYVNVSIIVAMAFAGAVKELAKERREEIPRQMFDVPIQAAIGARVIARETVKARRKDVLAKCYGGDISRKRKLLEKQKKGKKRMKQVGMVEVPQEAFLAVLNIGQ